LIAMGILNSVSLAVFWASLHVTTVFVVGPHSKRNIPNYVSLYACTSKT
jgi:hypothetical protein